MWKVRVIDAKSGDLVEHQHNGTLAEAEAHDFGGTIMVLQRMVPPKSEGAKDAAKGSDAVAVEKK